MNEFKIGDRVRCISDYGEGATVGDTGTVVGGDGSWAVYVEWDESRSCRHDCGGRCADYHGWNVPEGNLEVFYEVEDLGSLPILDLSDMFTVQPGG